MRTRPRTDKPVPAPAPAVEVQPEPVGDTAREELLLLAAPKVTTAKPKVEKKEKPRTAKEALQLRARQKGQPRPAKASPRERRAEREEEGVASAEVDRDEAATPRGPASSKKGRPESRRRPAAPEPQLDAVPPLPKPGLWTRIKGFFGG